MNATPSAAQKPPPQGTPPSGGRKLPATNRLLFWTLCGLAVAPILAVFLLPPQWWLACFSVHLIGHLALIYSCVRPNCDWFGPVTKSFRTNRKEVWLTFDDSPCSERTLKVLDTLREHNARATFFLIGEQARAHPELVRSILADGHDIGNHSATHPSAFFWAYLPPAVAFQIDAGAAAMSAIAGKSSPWFRSPVGMGNYFLHAALAQRQLKSIGWSARGYDAVQRDVNKIVTSILADLRPGTIILLHETPASLEALKILLLHFQQKGYVCVIPKSDQL